MSWIKLHRRLLDSDVFKSDKPEDLKLWIYFLLKASHKNYSFSFKVQGTQECIIIGPGSFVAGRQKIAEETGVSESKIRRFLEAKKATRKLTIKTTKQYSVITICKFKEYQLEEGEDNQESNQETGHIQEYIKGNTSNEVLLSVPKTTKFETPANANFEEWWIKYSKASHHPQGSKKNAAKNFSICIKKYSIEKINQATRNYLIECRRTNTKTKHAERFLKPDLIQQYQSEQETQESVIDRELRLHGRNTDALPSSAPRLESL